MAEHSNNDTFEKHHDEDHRKAASGTLVSSNMAVQSIVRTCSPGETINLCLRLTIHHKDSGSKPHASSTTCCLLGLVKIRDVFVLCQYLND